MVQPSPRRISIVLVLLLATDVSWSGCSGSGQSRNPPDLPGSRDADLQSAVDVRRSLQARKAPAPEYLEVNLTVGPFTDVTWRGWGTSLAWFANFIGGLPEPHLNELLDALFDNRRGLGLNIVRYVIPGGFNPAISPQLAKRPFQAGGWGFRPGPRRGYNWSADANQVRVLRGAVQRGADTTEAVAYSPPWWMTISKDTAGNINGKPNLLPRDFQAFVSFIVAVVENFKTRFGIELDGLNPFNEPQAKWWKKGGGQEGCAFDLKDMVTILGLTQRALAHRGLTKTKLVGLDDWAGLTVSALKAYPKELGALLERVAVHGYRTPTEVYRPSSKKFFDDFIALKAEATKLKKEVWDVEWGPFTSIPKDPSDLDLALVQSRSIAEQISVFGVSAFVYWQVVGPATAYVPEWPNPRRVGLIHLPFNYSAPFKPVYTKQYYCQMHYSKWVVPGSRILRVVGGERFIVVSYNPASLHLVLTVTNQRGSRGRVRINRIAGMTLVAGSTGGFVTSVYRTSETEDYRLVWRGTKGFDLEQAGTVEVPPWSITSIVINNVLVT